MPFDYSQQTVIITGASSGIGAAFARALAGRGASLVLVARRLDRLDAVAAQLRDQHGVAIETIRTDLASATAAADLRAEISRRGIAVTAVINNAGFGTFGPFAEDDSAHLAKEIAVDVAAPVSVSSAFLPDLRAARSGFLINVASLAAYASTPRMAVYAAAKAFVLSFTEALWAEERDSGVTVFALSPGATSTEFNAVVGTEDATSGTKMRTPEQAVATALRHLERRSPGPSVIDGAANRLSPLLGRLLTRRAAVTIMNRLTNPSRRAA